MLAHACSMLPAGHMDVQAGEQHQDLRYMRTPQRLAWHDDAGCCRRAQALQCLVSILRSLVEWYTAATPVATATEPPPAPLDPALRPDWGTLTSQAGGPEQAAAAASAAAPEADGEGEAGNAAVEPAADGEADVPLPGAPPKPCLLHPSHGILKTRGNGQLLASSCMHRGMYFLRLTGMVGRRPLRGRGAGGAPQRARAPCGGRARWRPSRAWPAA